MRQKRSKWPTVTVALGWPTTPRVCNLRFVATWTACQCLCHWLPVRFYLDDSQWQSRGDFCDFNKNPHQQRQQNNSITTQSISIFNPGSGAVFFFFLATARLQVKRFKIIALCCTGCFSVRNNHYLYVEISCLFLLFFFVNCSNFSYIYIYNLLFIPMPIWASRKYTPAGIFWALRPVFSWQTVHCRYITAYVPLWKVQWRLWKYLH